MADCRCLGGQVSAQLLGLFRSVIFLRSDRTSFVCYVVANTGAVFACEYVVASITMSSKVEYFNLSKNGWGELDALTLEHVLGLAPVPRSHCLP